MTLAPLVAAHEAAIPAIGLGTWRLTGEACAEAVRWGLEDGYRHIDTAAMYGNEEDVGAGLKASGVPRDEVFVTTKVWPENARPGDLERSAEASLQRLGLSEVDLLLLHWPNAAVPLAATMQALGRAKRRGLTSHIGVSNFTVRLLDEAVAVSDEPIVTNQCESHPYLDQRPVQEACRRHGMAFTAYAPLGRGDVLDDPVIRAIADGYGRTPAQVVLRWHVQQPGTVAIPKSGNRRRIAENFAVFDFVLSDADMRRISALARPDGRMVSSSWAPDWDRAA